jgi:hypothetical protein
MDNNYFTTVNPYFAQQDQQGLNPVFQNIAQQQANQNMALQQGMNLTNQAGMTTQGKQAGVGADQMAMAQMLRNQPGTSNFGARADMAMNSQASPYLQNQVNQLGSSTSNPFSDYNMGTNGWGNYGE